MLSKIIPNIPTVIVLFVLAAAVFFTVKKIIKDKRVGKSCCGNGCTHCAMYGQCHKK